MKPCPKNNNIVSCDICNIPISTEEYVQSSAKNINPHIQAAYLNVLRMVPPKRVRISSKLVYPVILSNGWAE